VEVIPAPPAVAGRSGAHDATLAAHAVLQALPPGAKVLFVRLRSLGDTVLSTPIYRAVKAWRPDLQLWTLVEAPFQQVLAGNPDLSGVLALDMPSAAQRSSLWVRLAMLRTIRRARFTCCIDLHGGSTGGWITRLSGAPARVGVATFRNARCYNIRLDLPAPAVPQHTVEQQWSWIRALGVPHGRIPPIRLAPDAATARAMQRRLRDAGLPDGAPYCVVQPTSRFHTKEWTAAGFAEVVDALWSQHGLRSVLTAGPGEDARVERVAAVCRQRSIVLTGLSIAELMALIARARLFVGNDSGPTHIAAGLQVPVVVLFGSSNSRAWYPWAVPHRVVQNAFACNPCPGYRCLVYDEPRCILSITAAQVTAAVTDLLGETDTGHHAHPDQ
jgi:heptosyltransferase-3